MAFSCIASLYEPSVSEFRSYFTRLQMALAEDFPRKREMNLLLIWIYAFLGEHKTIAEYINLAPEYQYSNDCIPLMGMLSFSGFSKLDPEMSSAVPLDIYELECRQYEESSYFYEAMELHLLLLLAYHLTVSRKNMMYHLKKGVDIARDNNFLIIPALYYSFYPKEFDSVLEEYPAEFAIAVKRLGKMLYGNLSLFIAQNNGINLYKDLSKNDYQFAAYACMGYTNRQVASFLKLSEKTVANRYNDIYSKLNISGKKELAALLNESLRGENK